MVTFSLLSCVLYFSRLSFFIYIYIYVTKQRFLYILEWLLNPCYVAFYISHAYCLMSLAYFFQTSLTPPAINVFSTLATAYCLKSLSYFFQTSLTPPAINVFSTLATAYCLKSLAYFLSISISFFTIISDVDNLVSNCWCLCSWYECVTVRYYAILCVREYYSASTCVTTRSNYW